MPTGPTLKQVARTGAVHAALLVAAGVLVGGLGGFMGLTADGTEKTAESAARLFVVLIVLFPLLLVVVNISPPSLGAYSSPLRGLLIGLIGGLGGGVIGALAYSVPATNIPVILGGEDAPDLSEAVRSEIGLTMFIVVVAVSAAVGLAAGLLTHYRVRAYLAQKARSQ